MKRRPQEILSSRAKIVVPILLALSLFQGQPVLHAQDENGGPLTITVDATPENVWHVLIEERQNNPRRKVLSTEGNETTIEEKIGGLPGFGLATCVFKEVIEPNKSIHDTLVSSSRLKSMDSSWELEPLENGTKTLIRYNSNFELTGLISREIARATSRQKSRHRLATVKKEAEELQAQDKK